MKYGCKQNKVRYRYYQIRMAKRIPNFYLRFLVGIILMTIIKTQVVPCHQFANGRCIRCPVGSHQYQQLCFKDVIGCQQYVNGDQCVRCDSTIAQLRGNRCVLTNPQLARLNSLQLRFRTNIGDQFGSPEFLLIQIEQARALDTFVRCDNWMRSSQYSFYISRASNPLVSVHTYIVSSVQHFKILYEGSGGGLFLCIIQINIQTFNITLSSFVAIGKSRIVQNCVQYDQLGRCRGCNSGYHLQSDLCYINIGSCTSYRKNLCLRCTGFTILLENRCAGDCKTLTDCRNNMFYLARATSQAIASQTGSVIDTTINSSGNTPVTPTQPNNESKDPNCASYDSNLQCIRCSFRFFKNNTGICQAVNPLCNGFDAITGNCTSCFQGYTLANGGCRV